MDDEELLENIIGFDALYESMYKCLRSVNWKDSVARFQLNGIYNVLKLEKELKTDKYQPYPTKKVQITHPKPREAVSIAFRDRVYQRSLNDNAVYPEIAKSLIYDNAACQKDKGTDFTRDRLDEFLRMYYRKHGVHGYVLQTDIKGYYPNMNHDVADRYFKEHLPEEVYRRASEILKTQYEGNVGYNPGSQMVQIVGISVLNPLDHYIKEQLRVEFFQRYVDDTWHIHPDKDFLVDCLEKETDYISKLGFSFHPKKTRIYKLEEGIKVLGFTHRLTKTGKVIRIIDPANVKYERKKLYRLVQLAKQGEITKAKVDECYKDWKAHAERGNSFKLLQRMDKYYKELWEDKDESGNKT